MQEHLTPETPTITPIVSRKWLSGFQDIYRFANGYGASVIRNQHSYGGPDLFELGVTRFTGKGNFDWELTYETPITNDVIGYLTTGDVQGLLVRIQALEVLAQGES